MGVGTCWCAEAYVCCSEAGELCARGWLICSGGGGACCGGGGSCCCGEPAAVELGVVLLAPNAESALFSRLCEIELTEPDLEPLEGGLKNESGNLRIRNGTCSGRCELGLSTESNSACRSESESPSIRTMGLELLPPLLLVAIVARVVDVVGVDDAEQGDDFSRSAPGHGTPPWGSRALPNHYTCASTLLSRSRHTPLTRGLLLSLSFCRAPASANLLRAE